MDRITEIEIGAASVGILGDPHLGRAFVRGVSLEKRGLREKMVMDDFRQRMQASGNYDVFICMGDLFDKWAVPYSVVFQAAWAYLEAARKNKKTRYFVIGGNHDISRDLEKKGALDLFELIVGSLPNVTVIRHSHDAGYFTKIGGDRVGLFPFHPTLRAGELVTDKIDVAFGHWDTMFGDGNLIPTKELAEKGCKVAYTGHVHLPDEFTRDGVQVIQVGSMQPYAHGEDYGEMYVTLQLDEFDQEPDLANKCVRLLLKAGEQLEGEIDCLQLTIQRAGANEEQAEEVTMGDFDLMALFSQAFAEAGVPEFVSSQIMTKFEEARVAE